MNSFDQVTRLAKQDDRQPLNVALDLNAEATELRLNAEQYDAFVAALDGPTTPKPQLEQLMNTPTVLDLESERMSAVDEVVEDSCGQTDYEADLRASIERGLAEAQAGRVVAIEDLVKEFGIED